MTTLLDGLQRYYRLDGNGTEEVSAQNGVPSGPITYPAGKRGTSADFNADDSRVITAPGLDLLGDLSISVWVRPTSSPGSGYRGIVGHGDLGGGPGVTNYTLTLFGLTPYFFGSSSAVSGQVLILNTWSHLVVTRTTAGEVKFYLNGRLTHTHASVGPSSVPGASLLIGNLPGAEANEGFGGLIDELAIYNTVLIQNQIVALFGEGTPPDYTNFGDPLPELHVYLSLPGPFAQNYKVEEAVILPIDLSCHSRGQQRVAAETFTVFDKPSGGSSKFNPGFN